MTKKIFRLNMTKSEQEIAKFIMQNKGQVANMSISDVANCCCVSKSMVTKFAINCGYTGFKDLKYSISSSITDDKLGYTSFYEKDDIISFYDSFSEQKINNLIEIFEKNDKIIFVGFGPSLGVGTYFQTRFRFSFLKNFVVENDETILEIETKSKEKVVIVYITASGNTKAIDDFINKFAVYDVTSVVVSESYAPKYEYLGINYVNLLPNIDEHNYVNIRSRTLFFIYFEEIIRRKLIKNEELL